MLVGGEIDRGCRIERGVDLDFLVAVGHCLFRLKELLDRVSQMEPKQGDKQVLTDREIEVWRHERRGF